jgi:hypothetical protein
MTSVVPVAVRDLLSRALPLTAEMQHDLPERIYDTNGTTA